MAERLPKNYHQRKMDFLDSLHPEEFRNGSSFHQSEIIFEQLNQAIRRVISNKEDPEIFIKKAVNNLFREDSEAIKRATEFLKGLSKDYETK